MLAVHVKSNSLAYCIMSALVLATGAGASAKV